MLRDGSEDEQQRARTELGLLMERLGLVAEAAEAYKANVDAGVSDRRPYERLAAIARAEGNAALEAATLRALTDIIDPPAAPPGERPTVESVQASAPALEGQAAHGPAPVPVNGVMSVAGPVGRRVQAWRQSTVAGATGLRDLARRASPGRGKPRELLQALPDGRAGVHWGALVAGVVVTLLVLVVGSTMLSARFGTSSAASPPSPAVDSPAPILPVVADAPSPAPVDVRLIAEARALASPTVVPPSPVALVSPLPSPTLVALPERCANASLRFPETKDTEAAVQTAYREYLARQGVTIDPTSTLFTGLGQAYAARHAEVVAGWMAVTLQRERRGLSTFSLTDYVASDVVVATGPNEYQLRATVSPQGWSDITSWPATSCEGAFIRDPANARWVQLMQAAVGDITWALPTQTPR